MLKIIVLGNKGVGKTSLLNRFAYNSFDELTRPTIAASQIHKMIMIQNSDVHL